MLDTEGQWGEALASNNIRAIICWLRKLTVDGEVDGEEILLTFSCWVQRTSEFAKKELLTLCFSRCQGLWMFLDRSSFTRVHVLLQKLRNLLTLAKWARRQLSYAHLWHGMGVPCVICRDTFDSSDIRRGCWNREQRALKQHIWLGRLVQWWGIMGLLPKYPETQEVKRISKMWKEMSQSHRKACLETRRWEEGEKGRFRSLIQGMVTQLDREHGCIWTSEGCTEQCYPPPNLQSLLKLVLVPHIDNMSVQALLMYFVLDMANFLQCKDDLLQSFCHAFTVPSSFCQQIRAFWMLDHGHTKASMELLLSPRAAVPWLSWQHRCIVHCLLMRKQPQLALRYLHWTRPAIESVEDAKLCADVLLQNSCVSEAWALLRRGQTESNNMVMYFIEACNGVGLCAEALKYIPAGYNDVVNNGNGIQTAGSQLPLMMTVERPACPLSAKLYQAQKVNSVSPEELVQLFRVAAMEVRKPHPKISEVVWPEHTERKSNSREIFLSTKALRHLTPSPSPIHMVEEEKDEETAPKYELDEEKSMTYQQADSPEHISSSEDLSSESGSSFTSASSLPLLRRGRPYVYESTLTLQRISSLLTDGENQSREEDDEEEDSRNLSSIDDLPDCPELIVTLDGTIDPIYLNKLNKEAVVELVLSAEGGEEDKTDVVLSEVLLSVDAVLGSSTDETLLVNKRMSLPSLLYSTEEIQSEPNRCETQLESHSFVWPDNEKMVCRKEASEENAHTPTVVTDLLSSAVLLKEGDQSDCILHEIFSNSDSAPSDSFPKEESYQKSYEQHQQEEAVGCFSQVFSFATFETAQDLLTDPYQSPLSEDPVASDSRASAGTDNKRPSLVLSPPCSYSLVNFMDFTAKQRGDDRNGKEADKEELTGWSSFGRGSRGAIRSGRIRSRKGKRVKRA